MKTGPESSRRSRVRGAAGATLVEYALIVALIAVPAIGAAQYLTTQARSQAVNQANCVSTRPPPASCQVRAITTTTTTAPPISTTTTAPPATTSTVAPPAGVAAWDTTASTWNKTTNVITLKLTLKVSPGNAPVAGAVVTVRMTITPGGQSFAAICTSDAAGVCTTTWAVPGTTITMVVGTVASIDSTPATPIPANALTWT